MATDKGDKMLKMRLVAAIISLCLWGCSSEQPTDTKKAADAKKPADSAVASRQPAGLSGTSENAQEALKKRPPAPPTRSELRVLSEDAKKTESAVQGIIKAFAARPDDRQARKDAEDKFKKLLPGYKEKMLLVGKAKLNEAKKGAVRASPLHE
jgi:hypothetical protein